MPTVKRENAEIYYEAQKARNKQRAITPDNTWNQSPYFEAADEFNKRVGEFISQHTQ